VSFLPDAAKVNTFARTGITFGMPREFETVNYWGRGPYETYIDRNQTVMIGKLRNHCGRNDALLCKSAGFGKSYKCAQCFVQQRKRHKTTGKFIG
jgi:hypothetical protein